MTGALHEKAEALCVRVGAPHVKAAVLHGRTVALHERAGTPHGSDCSEKKCAMSRVGPLNTTGGGRGTVAPMKLGAPHATT